MMSKVIILSNVSLFFVGDLCDRGVDSFAVIQRVKALVEQGKLNVF